VFWHQDVDVLIIKNRDIHQSILSEPVILNLLGMHDFNGRCVISCVFIIAEIINLFFENFTGDYKIYNFLN